MAFLRNFFAALTALFAFSILGLIVLFSIAGAASQDEIPVVKDDSVLWLKLSGVVKEREFEDPLENLFPNAAQRIIGLVELTSAIQEAKDDPDIQGIYMEHMYLSAGYSALQDIRSALVDFKTSGKFIFSYGEYISESDYYLASIADQRFLNPEGNLELNGLNATVTFYKGLFDKLDVEPEIFRVGDYKSAIEPFIRKDLSEENEYQMKELLNSLNNVYLENVSASLGKSFSELEEIQSKMLVQVPEEAVEQGIITSLAYEDEVKSKIAEEIGVTKIEDIPFISYKKYKQAIGRGAYSENRVAVIVAEGEILMGGDPSENIIGEKFANEIRKARENDKVKAIVLRVNSPGGSITASDMIWREVQRTKGVKPIVASMSSYAASGGYYIAMSCDSIYAQPNTITGSIGIFSVLFNLGDFLNNKLGISTDGVSTGEFSDLITMSRSLNENERAILQKGVDRGYETFISKASLGRGMDPDKMRELAGGRVWSGQEAKENGLIDLIGGLDDAVNLAAEMAAISEDYSVAYYPRQQPWIEELIGRIGDEGEARILGNSQEILSPQLEELKKIVSQRQGIQARIPGDLVIR